MQAENVQNIPDTKTEENIPETKTEENIPETKTEESAKVPVPASVVFVMDKSGSMINMGGEPIQGLNGFYKKQKESGDFISTLVFFSDDVVFHHENINGKDVPLLTDEDYDRNGMTALYDAIGKSIEFQRKIKTENVIFVILTDGHENSSREYNKKSIRTMITKMEKDHGWLFIYLGANQDSFAVSQGLGIRHSADYEYSPSGCADVFRAVSDNLSRCISNEVSIGEFKSEDINTASMMVPPMEPLGEENGANYLTPNFLHPPPAPMLRRC